MSVLEAALRQVILLFLVIGVGFAAKKLRLLTDEGIRDIGNIILRITFPSLLFYSIASYKGGIRPAYFALPLVFLAVLVVTFGIGFLLARLFKIKQDTLLASAGSVGNTAFLGLPVNLAVSGPLGAALAAIADVAIGLFFWGPCVSLITPRGGGNADAARRSRLAWLNPNLVAVTVGATLASAHVRTPAFILDLTHLLGGVTAPLGMMVIGYVIAQNRSAEAFTKPAYWLIALIKLGIEPGLAFAFAQALGITGVMRTTLVLQAGMPVLASLVVASRHCGADDGFAASAVFLTTLLSLITIPLWVAALTLS